jgi:hypothetical protein
MSTSTAQKVKCVSRGGYGTMKEGEVGTLIRKEPAWYDTSSPSGFLWPEYWIVETVEGQRVSGHAHRFEEIEASR